MTAQLPSSVTFTPIHVHCRTPVKALMLTRFEYERVILQSDASEGFLYTPSAAKVVLLRSPKSRTELEIEWLTNFLSTTRFLAQLPRDYVKKLSSSVTLQKYKQHEVGEWQDEELFPFMSLW